MDIFLNGNWAQMPEFLLSPHKHVAVEGRGTGKSADIGFWIDRLVRLMGRSVIALTGKTYGQLLTRTLPSSLKILNQIGYQKDVNYVIGRKPPANFVDSYEEINKFDNVISFSNGTRIAMISQSEPGSGRGANVDFEIADEALLLDRDQYVQEVSPTNRGNLEFFGKYSKRPVHLHHGFKYSTSMPVTKEGRWVLEYADYYYEERGIRVFDIWNRIVMLQAEMVPLAMEIRKADADGCASAKADGLKRWCDIWNEVLRLRRKIRPFVSKDGVLFTLANAFDNLKFLGMSYLINAYNNVPSLVFYTEILNMMYDRVEDCFYSLSEQKHIYYNSIDVGRVRGLAESKGFAYGEEEFQSSVFDQDCDPSQPLEICFDWGSKICLMTVHQPKNYDFVTGLVSPYVIQTQINEFFVKPDGKETVIIKDLIGRFCKYYESHPRKIVHFYRDRYGDHRNPGVLNSQTYNQQARDELVRHGWSVQEFVHRGMEPPMSDKYVLWGVILREDNDRMPRFRINGDRCKYTIISMNNAKVKNVDSKLTKDKSSERDKSGVLPEEATHFSDAVDKIIWTKYGERFLRGGSSSASFANV